TPHRYIPTLSLHDALPICLQQLGAVDLFGKIRARLHALRPDLMMYTEPNGVLLRQSMDLNYNYDETWLPASVYEAADPRYRGGRSEEHTSELQSRFDLVCR